MKHPGAAALGVTGSDPDDTGTWRTNPMSSHPHVPATIPTLVSANPDIGWSGGNSDHAYSDRRRWRNANHRRLRYSDYSTQQQYPAKSDASAVHFMISF